LLLCPYRFTNLMELGIKRVLGYVRFFRRTSRTVVVLKAALVLPECQYES
jgi:hypothetical protein